MAARYFSRLLSLILLVSVAHCFEIYHKAPSNFLQGVPGQLEVIVPHYLNEPDFIHLFIRDRPGQVYQELSFYENEGAWYCDIPAAYMNVDTLCYYIGASFGPAGLAALPAENPESNPFKVPLVRFNIKGTKFEPELVQKVIVDHTVTPWKPKPARRTNNFPVLYIPKANQAFIEGGFIKIIGNEKATAEDMVRSMLYLCLQENADAITELKFSLLSTQPESRRVEGHIELEGIYLRRPAKN